MVQSLISFRVSDVAAMFSRKHLERNLRGRTRTLLLLVLFSPRDWPLFQEAGEYFLVRSLDDLDSPSWVKDSSNSPPHG
jgi:hypothetical protein